MNATWNSLYQSAWQVINIFNQQPGYIQKYVLIIFANGQLITQREETDYQIFLQAIDSARTLLVPATSCMDSVYGGISMALTTPSFVEYRRSPIFVWTDALPNDDDLTTHNLYGQVGHFRGQIFTSFPMTQSDNCKVDPHDPAYRGLRRLAGYSQGLVNRENATDLVELSKRWATSIR